MINIAREIKPAEAGLSGPFKRRVWLGHWKIEVAKNGVSRRQRN